MPRLSAGRGRRRGETLHEWASRLRDAGLRGMGGAGFPTWRKWALAREFDEPRYLICNADEGDPGAYMDRSVLECDPHSVIEGLLLGVMQEQFKYINLFGAILGFIIGCVNLLLLQLLQDTGNIVKPANSDSSFASVTVFINNLPTKLSRHMRYTFPRVDGDKSGEVFCGTIWPLSSVRWAAQSMLIMM